MCLKSHLFVDEYEIYCEEILLIITCVEEFIILCFISVYKFISLSSGLGSQWLSFALMFCSLSCNYVICDFVLLMIEKMFSPVNSVKIISDLRLENTWCSYSVVYHIRITWACLKYFEWGGDWFGVVWQQFLLVMMIMEILLTLNT